MPPKGCDPMGEGDPCAYALFSSATDAARRSATDSEDISAAGRLRDFLRKLAIEGIDVTESDCEIRSTSSRRCLDNGLRIRQLTDFVNRRDVLLAGRTNTRDESTFGIVIFKAESDEAAQAFVDEDPAVKAGVMTAMLFPFRLAMLADDWDR